MGLNHVYVVTQEDRQHDAETKGIHWVLASTFIVGTMVGAGLVVLPKALSDTGLITGLIVLLGGAVFSVYTGNLLGENWLMMRKRWRKFALHCHDPYPEMATRALGKRAGIFVRLVLCISQFGVAVVFLILASMNISSLLEMAKIHIGFCMSLPAISLFLWPLVMLESPKDFWQAAVCAALCTMCAIGLLFYGIAIDRPTCGPVIAYKDPEIMGIFLSFGTALFAFGGHSCFPTFQNDMKNPKQFSRVIITAYLVIILMYVPVSVFAFLTYGNSLSDDASKSIQSEWIRHGVTLLITLHVTAALVIVIAPVSHSFEKLCNVPNRFCARRLIVRSLLWAAVLFMALSVPKFGVFLDLVGGSTMALLSLVFPPLFNMFLGAAEKKRQMTDDREENETIIASVYDVLQCTPKHKLLLNTICICIGVLSGVAATTSALRSIFSLDVATPCYMRPFIHLPDSYSTPVFSGAFCCGESRSIRAPFFNGTCLKH
ncbi:unnamed protein product, partial [Mesorhabditis belari]|uniref:Amino acid transporter transmembrane domain-containing protein n=1 Tax=Mesorhabditis belari TaxID=2138241 RepID=A0AAF3F5K9_9BILA